MKPAAGRVARALVLAGLLMLSGCASWYPQTNRLSENIAKALPSRHVIDDVPFFAQSSDDCGPATLAMSLAHRGYQVTPDMLAPLVYLPERGGSVPIEMMAASRRFDMLPYPIAPKLSHLVQEIRAGNPVLVLQNLGFSWAPTWHYALVVGFDLSAQEVYIHSDKDAYQSISLTRLERTWLWPEQPWAIVLMPPGELPETAAPLKLTQGLEALAVTGHVDAALKGYLAAVERWPEDRLLGLALGNVQYQSAHYRAAVNAYLNLLDKHPRAEEGWNNLSYALAQLGCDVAGQSSACALYLAPDNAAIRASQSDVYKILRKKSGSQTALCPVLPACPNIAH